MYAKPEPLEQLVKDIRQELEDHSEDGRLAPLVVNVELGFELLFTLGLEDEPITVLWVLLSGTPLRHPRLERLSQDQHKALATARVLLPGFASRGGWEKALLEYARIPTQRRQYQLDPDKLQEWLVDSALPFEGDDSWLAAESYRDKQSHPNRRAPLHKALTETLFFKHYSADYAAAGEYVFSARADHNTKTFNVTLTKEHAPNATKTPDWFTQPHDRRPIRVSWAALEDTAEQLEKLGGVPWVKRLQDIDYRDAESGEKPTELTLEGMTHLAGMVSSGKSTLAQLLTAQLIHAHKVNKEPMRRITLIVGDTASAIELADRFNAWFCEAGDEPVAVPLIGRSTRDGHLNQFLASRDYQAALKKGRTHWGERFLNPACPLQGLISVSEGGDALPLDSGQEPCQRLHEKEAWDLYKQGKRKTEPESYLCPLFATCPTHQRYRDMPAAQVWITTAGAMGKATLPRQLELRRIQLGDLIYEQSDLVVFDEVDTIIEWFDRLYAQTVKLTGDGQGLLDLLDPKTASYWSQNRSAREKRWIEEQRRFLTPATHILTLLGEYNQGKPSLERLVERGYFSSLSLFQKLSRRLLGLKEYELDETRRRAEQEKAKSVTAIFEHLASTGAMGYDPPEDYRAGKHITFKTLHARKRAFEKNTGEPRREEKESYRRALEHLSYELALLKARTLNDGDSTQNPALHQACKTWIKNAVPDIEERLKRLRRALEESDEEADEHYLKEVGVDTLETLAHLLEFTLDAVLLDRYLRRVFYGWHERPNVVTEENPNERVPQTLLNILPVPPTGRRFGIYHSATPDAEGKTRTLSTLGYTNIGRHYVTNFHRLRSALEERPGPNVLAMSGTSYLPDSTRWHFRVKPKGVLKPSQKSIDALRRPDCWFRFTPVISDKPIHVSGNKNKRKALKGIAVGLVGEDGRGGKLGEELKRLRDLAAQDEKAWSDRGRLLLLVNSYDQSRWVAEELRSRWDDAAIFHLSRRQDSDDEQNYRAERAGQVKAGQLERVDIEQFAQTGGDVLVAPLQAIGRGFNILNKDGKAAFGALYFLTRPMPHPHDAAAIAQELNCRSDDWFEDEAFEVWERDSIYGQGLALRSTAAHYWRRIEGRNGYRTLADEKDESDEPTLHENPRRDLAATTAGKVIQAVGRLLRGNTPFHGYFVDAAWAPEAAKRLGGEDAPLDTPRSSLLAAMIDVLGEYTDKTVGRELYQPLLETLEKTEDFEWAPLE